MLDAAEDSQLDQLVNCGSTAEDSGYDSELGAWSDEAEVASCGPIDCNER